MKHYEIEEQTYYLNILLQFNSRNLHTDFQDKICFNTI